MQFKPLFLPEVPCAFISLELGSGGSSTETKAEKFPGQMSLKVKNINNIIL